MSSLSDIIKTINQKANCKKLIHTKPKIMITQYVSKIINQIINHILFANQLFVYS